MECIKASTEACGGGAIGSLVSNLLGALLISQCTLGPPEGYPNHDPSAILPTYDFIVVGGGSSGSALSARLSENPNWNVLLLEAGKDPSSTSELPSLLFTLQNTEQDWKYQTEPQKNACQSMNEQKCTCPRGKVLGGSSVINANIYLQGHERNYDEWEEMGNEGWGWDSVKKYFDRFSVDENLDSFNRPFGVKTVPDYVREAIISAGSELGLGNVKDRKDVLRGTIGYYECLGTLRNGTRANAAEIFLVPAKNRKNLHVVKNAHVGKLLIDKSSKQVEGVEVWLMDKWTHIKVTKEVILSAGSINTPQILMLSGIGPKEHLESIDIPVLKDLPVGQNLQDHTIVSGIFHSILKSKPFQMQEKDLLDALYFYMMHRIGPFAGMSITNTVGFLNSKNESDYPDLQFHHIYFDYNDFALLPQYLAVTNYIPETLSAITELTKKSAVFVQVPTLLKPKSRGTVTLQSKDPFEPPLIDHNLLGEPEDIETILIGMKHSIKMGQTQSLRMLEAELVFPDLPNCRHLEPNTDEHLICHIKDLSTTIYHPVGTAKMGTGSDSVVDSKLKVHGIKGLRVADASIMPEIVSANTNAACIMIGEKAADLIKDDWNLSHNEL